MIRRSEVCRRGGVADGTDPRNSEDDHGIERVSEARKSQTCRGVDEGVERVYKVKKSFVGEVESMRRETLSSAIPEFSVSVPSATQLLLQTPYSQKKEFEYCNPDFVIPYSDNIYLPTCFTRKEWNYLFSHPEVYRRRGVYDKEASDKEISDETSNKEFLNFLFDRKDKIDYLRGGYADGTSPTNIFVSSINVDLSQYLTKYDWEKLSLHPKAIPLLEHYMEYIDWWKFSMNPGSIPFLEKNPDKIIWLYLSLNPNALHLLAKNSKEIAWTFIERNYGFYDIDYELIEKRTSVYKKELIENALHPRRIARIYDIIGDDCEIEKYI